MTDGGQQFGKYRIVEELGVGGFATVYKAVDTTLDREVALKILHPPLLTDRRFVQNFRQEAKTLAALRHPQIITVYEVGEADGRLFIAMDLAHGLSLAQSIAKCGRIPWDETLALLKPVCDALDYAHNQKVVHRDFKPANLLLDTQRGALLTDFGFARLMAENTMSMSMSGGIVGTPGYIAPEVWEENAASPPVDIYALGCIVYEMLTGDVLFKGQTPMQAMYAHSRGPQFPETWPAGVPKNFTVVLSKALARDPAARYGSAGALWHALNDLEAQEQVAREVAQRTALAMQWRAEAERALAANELDAARMAIGRWRAVAPEDATIQEVQTQLNQLAAPSTSVLSTTPHQSTSSVHQKVLAELLIGQGPPESTASSETAGLRFSKKETQPTSSARGTHKPKNFLLLSGLAFIVIVMFMTVLIVMRSAPSFSGNIATIVPAPTPFATITPRTSPTNQPTAIATLRPTAQPTAIATLHPTAQPTAIATLHPTAQPTVIPEPPTVAPPAAIKLKIGMVTDIAKLGDKSFNDSAWAGVQSATKDLGVEPKVIETTDPNDYEKNIGQLVSENYNVIVTVGFALADATNTAAKANPNIKFIGVDQFQAEEIPNVAGLVFNEDQAGYLAGYLAASMSKSGKIGAVLGTDAVPPVWRFGEGYRAGALAAKPDIQVQTVYHNDVGFDKTFSDPDWGKATALSMIDQGVDIVFGAGGRTGNGALFAAEDRKDKGVLAIGVDTDQYLSVPEAKDVLISSAMKIIDQGVTAQIKQVTDGNFQGGNVYGEVGLAPSHDLESKVPASLKTDIENIRQQLITGSRKTNVSLFKPG